MGKVCHVCGGEGKVRGTCGGLYREPGTVVVAGISFTSTEWNVCPACHGSGGEPTSLRFRRLTGRDKPEPEPVVKAKRQLYSEAVAEWQRAHGLPADGMIGPASKAAGIPTGLAKHED